MNALAFALCVVAIVAMKGVIVVLLIAQWRERAQWISERRQLVDRSISKHAGEVVALDRAATPRPVNPDHAERPTAVGL